MRSTRLYRDGTTRCHPEKWEVILEAVVSVNAGVFYTFDEKNSKKSLGLLQLAGDVAGYPLQIKKPSHAQLSLLGVLGFIAKVLEAVDVHRGNSFGAYVAGPAE